MMVVIVGSFIIYAINQSLFYLYALYLNNIAIMNNVIMRNVAELQLPRTNLINLNMHDTFKLNENYHQRLRIV